MAQRSLRLMAQRSLGEIPQSPLGVMAPSSLASLGEISQSPLGVMAPGSLAPSSLGVTCTAQSPLGIQKLAEQLTCPVCFDCYDNPKTLPCLHSFCLKCIQQLPVDLDKGKYQIRCPTCRKKATLPDSGVADLPSSFVINSLLEIQELLKELVPASEGQQICCGNCQVANATRYCKECATVYCEECLACHNKLKVNITHSITDVKDVASNVYSMKQEVIMNCINHNKPLEIFCDTCNYLICRSCTVSHHQGHNYDNVADAYPRHQHNIESALQLIKCKEETINDLMKALMEREKEIIHQGDDTTKEIPPVCATDH